MKSDKRQTLALVGISLIVIAGVLMFVAMSQPKIYVQDESTAIANQMSQSDVSVYSNTQSVQTANVNTSSVTEYISYPININTATVQELCTIDGIGEKRAEAIIQYRQQIGGYTSVEQIKNIQGIGDAIYAKVSPYLTV
ncbi:MAG: ComEA family DNA-binding protein [Eubacterium sp.]